MSCSHHTVGGLWQGVAKELQFPDTPVVESALNCVLRTAKGCRRSTPDDRFCNKELVMVLLHTKLQVCYAYNMWKRVSTNGNLVQFSSKIVMFSTIRRCWYTFIVNSTQFHINHRRIRCEWILPTYINIWRVLALAILRRYPRVVGGHDHKLREDEDGEDEASGCWTETDHLTVVQKASWAATAAGPTTLGNGHRAGGRSVLEDDGCDVCFVHSGWIHTKLLQLNVVSSKAGFTCTARWLPAG